MEFEKRYGTCGGFIPRRARVRAIFAALNEFTVVEIDSTIRADVLSCVETNVMAAVKIGRLRCAGREIFGGAQASRRFIAENFQFAVSIRISKSIFTVSYGALIHF